jgi:hypothetical protein
MKFIQKIELDVKNAAGTIEAVVIDVEDLLAGKPLPTTNPKAAHIVVVIKELIVIYGDVKTAMAIPAVQTLITALEAL